MLENPHTILSVVMRGLDPRIHDEIPRASSLRQSSRRDLMDCRVIGVRKHAVLRTAMPGNDRGKLGARLLKQMNGGG
jgi:hypothetical protein